MADYKLWNALKDAKKYRWVELSHSLNNESPYWSGIPEGSVAVSYTHLNLLSAVSWNRDLSRSNRTRRARRFSPYQSEVLLCRSTEGP